MSIMERFEEAKLPDLQCFYSRLDDKHISDGEYTRAETVLNAFVRRTMLEYHNTYLTNDILLLADIFENVRRMSMETYKLGGISQISHRHATSNHPAMNTYYPNEATRTLTYQDANALYSCAMSQSLPTKNYQWIDPQSVDVLSIPDDHHLGYILEVDLEYPEALRDSHND